MTKKKRVILAVLIIELGFAGLWLYLARMGMTQPDRISADFQTVLGQTMGTVMGGFLGFGLLAFFIAAKNDRSA